MLLWNQLHKHALVAHIWVATLVNNILILIGLNYAPHVAFGCHSNHKLLCRKGMYANWEIFKHAYEKLGQCGLSVDFVALSSWKPGLKKCAHPPCCLTPWPCKAWPTQTT
jgi:hypothetical protein